MKSWFRKVKETVVSALKQGWSLREVCWSTAWGVTVGIFPIYGVTTAALGLMGVVWKLNHAVMQAFNYLVSPLKFALILPYIRLGEWMFRETDPFSLSVPEFARRFRDAPMETLGEFAMTFVHAISGWAVTLPIWLVAVYGVMYLVIRAGESTRAHIEEVRT